MVDTLMKSFISKVLAACLIYSTLSVGASAASYTPSATVFESTAVATAPGSSTAAQTLVGVGINEDGTTSPTLPANFFSTPGSAAEIQVQGYYSSGTITTQTLTFNLKFGSTTIAASGAITPVSTVVNGAFTADFVITDYTTGSSGTVQVNSVVALTGASLTGGLSPLVNTSAVTLNTTTSQAVTFTATWGGSPTSSQTITSTNFTVLSLPVPMAATSSGGMTPDQVAAAIVSGQGLTWYAWDASCITHTSGCATLTNGATVTTVYDKSGNGNTLTCGTGSTILNTGVINGQPAFTLGGGEACTAANTVDASQSITIFMEWNTADISIGQSIFSQPTGGFGYTMGAPRQSTQKVTTSVLGSGTASLVNGVWVQTATSYDQNTAKFYIGQTTDGTSTPGTSINANQGVTMFANGNSGGEQFNGGLARIDIFIGTTVVNPTNLTAMQNAYHGLYGN